MSADRLVLFIALVLLPLDWSTYLFCSYCACLCHFSCWFWVSVLQWNTDNQISENHTLWSGLLWGSMMLILAPQRSSFLHISSFLAMFQVVGTASGLYSLAQFGSLSSGFHSTLTTGVPCPLSGLPSLLTRPACTPSRCHLWSSCLGFSALA